MLILSHLDDFAQEQVAEKAEDNWEKMANAFEYNHASEPVHLWAFHQVTVGTWAVPKLYSNGCTCSIVTNKLNSICPSKLMIQWCSSWGYLRYNFIFWWASYYSHSRPWYKMHNCSSWLTYGAWCNLNNLYLAGMSSLAYCCINLWATWFCSWTSIPSRIFRQLFRTDRYLVNLCITYSTVSSCKETYNTLMQVLML